MPAPTSFALGVNFYEMLTGTRPFQGETPASTLSAVLKDEPRSLTELVPSLPRDIARIVKRCLAKDPSRRYQTTIDVRNELEELARALDSGETMVDAAVSLGTPASRRVLSWIAVAGGGLLVALPANVGSIDDLAAALQEKARHHTRGRMGARYALSGHEARPAPDAPRPGPGIDNTSDSYSASPAATYRWSTSYALEMAGITRRTPDPAGGGFERDATGEPTGVVWENAIRLVNRAGPPLPEPTREEELEGLGLTYESFLSKGITSIVDAGGSSASFRRYQDAVAHGQPVRVTIMFRNGYLADLAWMAKVAVSTTSSWSGSGAR